MIDQLQADLKRHEGVRFVVYKCPAGKNTIGVGRNLDDVPLTAEESRFLDCSTADLLGGKALTAQQVDYLLAMDVARVCAQLDKAEPWWVTRSDSTRRALANMVFQMGLRGVQKFKKMLACLQAGDYEGAKRHALDSAWARQTPKRAAEVVEMFKP